MNETVGPIERLIIKALSIFSCLNPRLAPLIFIHKSCLQSISFGVGVAIGIGIGFCGDCFSQPFAVFYKKGSIPIPIATPTPILEKDVLTLSALRMTHIADHCKSGNFRYWRNKD
jgi:hypothetical protein